MSDPRKAMAIIEQLLDVPEQEWSTFIDKACMAQPQLRTAVESLLQAMDAATGMLPF